MSIGFNPQNPSVKQIGREELADKICLPMKKLKPYFKKADVQSFQANYNSFVIKHPVEAKQISALRPDGVGPGELVAWFLFDNIQLGGKNSSIDLLVDGADFAEMKGGRYDTKYHALCDFKITKDSDPAVDLLRTDLGEFNDTYYKITGSNLPGWDPGNILTTTLRIWDTINLKKEAKLYAGPARHRIQFEADVNGNFYQVGSKKPIANWKGDSVNQEIARIMTSDIEVTVNNHTSTLKKIVGRWRQLAFKNYLAGKRFALVNTSTMKMEHFGTLTVDMIDLLRIARNQPSAKIYLPKEKQ